ncbi:hypothetical protein FHW83_003309 [Duganella sp. SG902]|uniref:hypothetical protein n=1 Tax=Duganella sp. SG902 TaxID=2587016 RepID=UPI00159E3D4C|nr:hypothetical protein [Duganella sp. SG902]NVM77491.1 hypothetical protein [Duganella sp. SG902]
MSTSFEYWFIKNGKQIPKRNPKKTKPLAYIQRHFSKLALHCPPAYGPFAPTVCISQKLLFKAALCAGYGPKGKWPSLFKILPAERVILLNALTSNFRSVECFIQFSSGKISLHSAYRLLDPTVVGQYSYDIGSMAAYIAMDTWLDSAGAKIEVCLHTTVFQDSMISVVAGKVGLKIGRSLPDYVVKDNTNQWHALEAKGGSERWSKVYDGLQQLRNTANISTSVGAPPVAFASMLCTHARVDAGQEIDIVVVDPPGDNNRRPDKWIVILPQMVELLGVLESISRFRSLQGVERPYHLPESVSSQLFRQFECSYSNVSMDLRLLIPRALLKIEITLMETTTLVSALVGAMQVFADGEAADRKPTFRSRAVELLKQHQQGILSAFRRSRSRMRLAHAFLISDQSEKTDNVEYGLHVIDTLLGDWYARAVLQTARENIELSERLFRVLQESDPVKLPGGLVCLSAARWERNPFGTT